jgi:homoprotocatechuate degradation regulator HpaR
MLDRHLQSHPEKDSVGMMQDDANPIRQRRSLAIGLLRAREAVMSHFRPILAAHDVTEQQWRVIRVLHEAGTLDASEVADKAFILAPSLTRMIKSLEQRGFITKHKDKADGRRVLLRIAPAGRAIIEEVMPDSRRVYAEIDARFGRERVDQLLDMLDDLASIKLDGAAPIGEE